MSTPNPNGMSNKDFAQSNQHFIQCCDNLKKWTWNELSRIGVSPAQVQNCQNARQAAKFRRGEGIVFKYGTKKPHDD